MLRYTFDEINSITGFANGAKFTSDDEVRDYFSIVNLREMFSDWDGSWHQETLDGMARTVIVNRWWMEWPDLVPVKEAARRLSLSPRQVWKLLREGRLQGFKLNRQNWRVQADSVSRFALDQTETGTKEDRR